jgi:hypothetical protein
VARRQQLAPPSCLLQQVGSGKGAQRQIEVLGVPGHRTDHGYVDRLMIPGGPWPRVEISPQLGLWPQTSQ